MELLVGIILVWIIATGSTFILLASRRSLENARTSDRREALIDDDVARMQELATRLTCCDGTCTSTPTAGSATCQAGATPGDDRYYYILNPAANAAFLENAATATPPGRCNNGGIGDAMIAQINLPANAPDAAFTAAGLARAVSRWDGSVSPAAVTDGRNHTVRLTYTSASVNRVVYVLPPAAAWCP